MYYSCLQAVESNINLTIFWVSLKEQLKNKELNKKFKKEDNGSNKNDTNKTTSFPHPPTYMTSSVSFATKLQITWKPSFANSDNVVGLNLIHPEVIKLLQVNSKDELSESAWKEVIESITDLNLNTIIFK